MKNLKKLPKVPQAAKAVIKKKPNFGDIQEGISTATDAVSAVTEGVQAVSDIMQSHSSGKEEC